jgi:hypothetical protein
MDSNAAGEAPVDCLVGRLEPKRTDAGALGVHWLGGKPYMLTSDAPERASACGLTECSGKPECERCAVWRLERHGMPASADERHLRRLLAARVAMPHTYMDDGEAFGQEQGISIDFMREPVADIDAKLRALGVARAKCSMGLCSGCGCYHKPGDNPLCER